MVERVSNEFLLEEIRENRRVILTTKDEVSGKVGRGELVGWLSATSLLIGMVVMFMR